jgi:hypothetical protein
MLYIWIVRGYYIYVKDIDKIVLFGPEARSGML